MFIRSSEVEMLSDDRHVLFGMDENVAVLDTQAGSVLVDMMTFQ